VEDFKEAAMETRLQIDTPNLKDYRGYNFGLPAHVANKARREAKRLNVPWPLLLEPNFEKNPELKIPWNHGDAYNWDMSVKKPGDPPNAYGE
jgi:hypothetical protein